MTGIDLVEVRQCGVFRAAASTEQGLIDSTVYCLAEGDPPGYICCTGNVPFSGALPERYRMILDIWGKLRNYN